MPNPENLRPPIQPGEKRALKKPADRKTETLKIRVTKSQKKQLDHAASEKKQTLSAYLLDGKLP